MPRALKFIRRVAVFVNGRYLRRPVNKRRIRRYKRKASGDLFGPKVLVALEGGIGDAIEATPIIPAIRILWPRAVISLYCPPGDLMSGWSIVDRTVDHSTDLSQESFDHLIIGYAAKTPEESEIGQIHRIHHARSDWQRYCLKPQRDYNVDVVRKLGYRGPTPPLYVSIKQPDLSLPDGRPCICIAPGGVDSHLWRFKKWPHYLELTTSLLKEYPQASLLILGTLSDEFPESLLSHEQVVDLRGKLSLAETAWVMKHSELVVGNDCGPMHIADAVLVPSLILYGPSCELRNGPEYRGFPVSLDVPCRPCQYDRYRDDCDHGRCIRDITCEMVMKVIRSTLSEGKAITCL